MTVLEHCEMRIRETEDELPDGVTMTRFNPHDPDSPRLLPIYDEKTGLPTGDYGVTIVSSHDGRIFGYRFKINLSVPPIDLSRLITEIKIEAPKLLVAD